MTTTARAGTAPEQAGELTHKQIMVVLSGLLLGMFLAALDQTVVSTAMRTIADRLDGQTGQAWVTTAYLITSTITTPLYGKLSDSYGRKPFYVFAIGVFVFGSVLCGLATNIYELAAYRAVQGIDFLGAGLLTSTVVPVLLLAEKGRDWGWASALSLGLLALAVGSLVSFVACERRAGEAAILPLRIFSSSIFSLTSMTALLVGAGMFGGIVVLPLYLQIVRGASPTAAGLQLLPLMGGIFVMSAFAGKVMQRTGRYKALPVGGTAVMFVALLLMSTLGVDSPLWHAMVFMALMGAGLGLCMQTLVISVQNALPPRDMGVATSSVSFFRSLGGTLGAAVSLGILFGSLAGNIQDRARAAGLPQDVVDRFGEASALDDSSIIPSLPDAVERVVLQGFADSMSTVFLVVAFLLVPAFVLSLLVKEAPLRAQGGMAAAQADAKAAEAASAARAESAVLSGGAARGRSVRVLRREDRPWPASTTPASRRCSPRRRPTTRW